MTGKGKALGIFGYEKSDSEDDAEPEDPQINQKNLKTMLNQKTIAQLTFDHACSTRAFGAMSDETALGPDDRTLVAWQLKGGIMCFANGNHVRVGEVWYLLLVMLLLQTTYMIS
jgi:hypothetical protein